MLRTYTHVYDKTFRELNFGGLKVVCENRGNYAPRKSGAIQYVEYSVALVFTIEPRLNHMDSEGGVGICRHYFKVEPFKVLAASDSVLSHPDNIHYMNT
jgi:hypothetical protein